MSKTNNILQFPVALIRLSVYSGSEFKDPA